MSDLNIPRNLALAGTLPFVVCTLAAVGVSVPGLSALPWAIVANSYGLAIVSFMAGAQWGLCLSRPSPPIAILLFSNAVTLVAWSAFLTFGQQLTLFVLAVAFIALLVVDWRLHHRQWLSQHYWRTRLVVTAIVVVCLLLMATSL
ncbi:MAG: hypothetical protein DHS20C11_16380 [Lysobacteraceae bacterium]|nr:MAG: hypothetical protein DHS20C11_16380 [Xanthomonadaceae bacterium]